MKRQKEVHMRMVDWVLTPHTVVAVWDLTACIVNFQKCLQFQGTIFSMGSVKTTLSLVSLLTWVCTPSLINLLHLTNYKITLDSVGKGTYISVFVCDQVKMLFTISKPFWKISLKLSWRIFISTASLLSPDLHIGVQKMLTVPESLLKTG